MFNIYKNKYKVSNDTDYFNKDKSELIFKKPFQKDNYYIPFESENYNLLSEYGFRYEENSFHKSDRTSKKIN